MISCASCSPHPTMKPFFIANPVSIHSLVPGEKTFPPITEMSAGVSPLATESISFEPGLRDIIQH